MNHGLAPDFPSNCVLLADRHYGLRDRVQGLLETVFETVFMVADPVSLVEGAAGLHPAVAVIDLSLASGDLGGLLARVRERSPASRVLILTVHDEAVVAHAALVAGADGVVLKSGLATDLLPAVDALLAGNRYRSPGIRV